MNLPDDITLPFFAYGVFKPGELAFLQIRAFVIERIECTIAGELCIRDGLPIISPNPKERVNGALLKFFPECKEKAYQAIVNLEPDKQYHWAVAPTTSGSANYLVGRSPNKGSIPAEKEWDGRNDPLFTVALEVVQETLESNRNFEWDLKPLFRLEMAYLLLWTCIERYASLRYHFKDKAADKVFNIAEESAFQLALQKWAHEPRSVQRADDPTQKAVLDPKDAAKSIKYYYQIRSNLVHRGKGLPHDHDRLKSSLEELLNIFRDTLDAAFLESSKGLVAS